MPIKQARQVLKIPGNSGSLRMFGLALHVSHFATSDMKSYGKDWFGIAYNEYLKSGLTQRHHVWNCRVHGHVPCNFVWLSVFNGALADDLFAKLHWQYI